MKFLAGTLVVLSVYGQTPILKVASFYTVEREIAFGKAVTVALERQVSVVHDAAVDAYLKDLGRMLPPAGEATFIYRFVTYKGRRIGSADEVVALPGGTVLIPLRSVADASTSAAIAGKIAHAIAHIELRTIPMISMGTTGLRPVANARLEAEADRTAVSYLSGLQEDTAGFEAARTAAQAALEQKLANLDFDVDTMRWMITYEEPQ